MTAGEIAHPERIKKLAVDIVEHYERLCTEKPYVVQKAMIVCTDRKIALKVLQEIISIRPAWGVVKKSEDDKNLSKDRLKKLLPLPKINLVATQGQNDPPELFNLCGTKNYRKKLDKQFKNNDSNFKVAVVVDMWITGFDVPSLAVMYIDKPLQKHTLIQTISRVNHVFNGKDKGLVIDYIGFKDNMLEAVKKYGSQQESPIDELKISLNLFRNYLDLLSKLTDNFNAKKFFNGTPKEKLTCLNAAAEFVQRKKETETNFMNLSKKLKAAYLIVSPSGEINEAETAKAQFFLAIRTIIFKQTKGDTPDTEIMNCVVEKMVEEALACTGIENIVGDKKSVDLFSEDFLNELNSLQMPITKFNALLKLVKKNIVAYEHSNKVKSTEFDKRLKKIVEEYNSRDKFVFVKEIVENFVDKLSDKLILLWKDIEADKKSFERLGINYEEKIFFDILIAVRDIHSFPYTEEKCLVLAREIKKLIDEKSKFADWANRSDIKADLESKLVMLLYKNDYPIEWGEEVFVKIMEQMDNLKS
jgi:type I restriction enzyme R subunit